MLTAYTVFHHGIYPGLLGYAIEVKGNMEWMSGPEPPVWCMWIFYALILFGFYTSEWANEDEPLEVAVRWDMYQEKEEPFSLEMATSSSVFQVNKPSYLLAVAYEAEGSLIFTGSAFYSLQDGKPCVYTALHNIEDRDFFYLLSDPKNGKKMKIVREKVEYDCEGQIVRMRVPDNFASLMGVKPVHLHPLALNRRVTIFSYGTFPAATTSEGLIDKDTVPLDIISEKAGRFYCASYSSRPGDSGSPILQNGKVVGVHVGALTVRNKNYFQSLLPFLPLGFKHLVARNKKLHESSTASFDKYETDYDWEDSYNSLRNSGTEEFRKWIGDYEEFREVYENLNDEENEFTRFASELRTAMNDYLDGAESGRVNDDYAKSLRREVYARFGKTARHMVHERSKKRIPLNSLRAPSPKTGSIKQTQEEETEESHRPPELATTKLSSIVSQAKKKTKLNEKNAPQLPPKNQMEATTSRSTTSQTLASQDSKSEELVKRLHTLEGSVTSILSSLSIISSLTSSLSTVQETLQDQSSRTSQLQESMIALEKRLSNGSVIVRDDSSLQLQLGPSAVLKKGEQSPTSITTPSLAKPQTKKPTSSTSKGR
jgi:flagellin-like hook-associated protein FlgL